MTADSRPANFRRIQAFSLAITVASASLFAASLAPSTRGYGHLLFGLAVAGQILLALMLIPALGGPPLDPADGAGPPDRPEPAGREQLDALHAELALAREEAATALATVSAKDEEIERFTYIVSHDLRSPLLTIQGFADILVMDIEDGKKEAVEEDIEHILQATQRLRLLLDDLLELSRIGRLTEPAGHVSLNAVVRDALDELGPRLQEVDAVVDVAPDLPSVTADRSRIQQLLGILIDNSLRYRGDRPPNIKITGRPLDDGAELTVADRGEGLEAGQLETAFGPFERFSAASKGSGMGLAHAQRIVAYHRGAIRAESPGKGQGLAITFSLREPLVDEASGLDAGQDVA